jgi:hypothetical protein
MIAQVFYNAKEQKCLVISNEKKLLFDSIMIENATFRIDEQKRAEYLKNNIPNNHAFVQGEWLIENVFELPTNDNWQQFWRKVRYNRERGFFEEIKSGEIVIKADIALIIKCDIFIQNKL